MIRRLKVVLGPEAYASFRRAARASQLGKVAIPDYFAYVRARPARPPRPARGCGRDVPRGPNEKPAGGPFGGGPRDETRRWSGFERGRARRGRARRTKRRFSRTGWCQVRGAPTSTRRRRLTRAAFEAGEANDAKGNRGFMNAWMRHRARRVSRSRATAERPDAAAASDGGAKVSALRLNQRPARTRDPRRRRVPGKVDRAVHGVRVAGARRHEHDAYHAPHDRFGELLQGERAVQGHRDSEDPEVAGTPEAPPIVSFTVGASCDFAVKRPVRGRDADDDPARLRRRPAVRGHVEDARARGDARRAADDAGVSARRDVRRGASTSPCATSAAGSSTRASSRRTACTTEARWRTTRCEKQKGALWVCGTYKTS